MQFHEIEALLVPELLLFVHKHNAELKRKEQQRRMAKGGQEDEFM